MSKIRNLPENTNPEGEDLLYSVDTSESSNAGRKVKVSSLKTPLAQKASEVPYQRGDADKKDIQSTSDDVEAALSDLDDKKLSRSGSQPMTGSLDMGAQNIVDVGTVDGRDVSQDGQNLDDHLTSGPNRHIADNISYERTDSEKKDIQTGSDTVEEALTDLDDEKLSRSGNQSMTGNLDMGSNSIANVGTVDGRDVSADGSKLDTIETNAAADQNASEVPFDNTNTNFASTNVQDLIEEVDNFFSVANEIIVSKTPGPGEFSSITAALDSITTNSILNPFVVRVKAGIYTEPTIVSKPFVAIQGSSTLATVIQVNDPSSDVVHGVNSSFISNVTLTGSTAQGSASVFLNSSTIGEKSFIAQNIVLGQTNIGFRVTASEGRATLTLEAANVNDDTTFDKLVSLNGSSDAEAVLRTGNVLVTQFRTPFPSTIFELTGPGAELIAGNVATEMRGGSVIGIDITDGSNLKILSASFRGFDRGLLVRNIGEAPTVRCAGLIVENSFSNDIELLHPSTSGYIFAVADSSKLVVNSGDTTKIVVVDSTGAAGTGLVTLGSIKQGETTDRLLDLSDLIRKDATMGLTTGGDLSDGGGLSVDVSAGSGFAIDNFEKFVKQLNWESGNLSLSAKSANYIFINNNGTISASGGLPNLKENIVLGRAITNATSIDFFDRSPSIMVQSTNDISSFNRLAIGAVYSSGSIVKENTTNDRELDVSIGQYWFASNEFNPSGGSSVNFIEHYRDGSGGFIINSGVQKINNTQYDDGSGTLASLSAGFFAKHSFYIVGDGIDETYLQVFSQSQFDSLSAAETAPLPTPPPFFVDGVVPIASIIVQEGQPNIQKILDERPIIGTNISAVSATSDHGSLSGLQDDDHTQYLRTDGGRPLSGNLDIGNNSIVNVSTVDGVDISSHASRHLPTGADPLDTAAPTTNLTGNTTNSEGNANSFSRSNHTHAINDATTSVAGLMSTADKIKLNDIEANAKDDQNANEVPYDNSTSGLSATNVKTAIDEVESRVDTAETDITNLQANKQDISEKGQANGYAGLNSSGKVPLAQLPNAILEYKGMWNADLNDPTLSDGSGNPDTAVGDVYRVSVAGTQDLGSGPISFGVGDYVILNNNKIWEKADTTDAVSSVFGRQGAVVAQAGDYDDVQIDYTRDDGFKKSILAGSDDVGSAINDLDDNKLARSGIQAMTGSLDMGGNSVTNVNLVDGVDVSSHGTRHNPDGADPVSTAAPVTLNPDQANSIGTANSLSRSDHIHNIPADTAVNTSSNTNTEGTSSSFARADHTHQLSSNTPTTNQLIRWDGSNWTAYDPVVAYLEEEADETTSGTSYAESFKATFNIPETGNYIIEWQFEIWNETDGRATQGRAQLDDSITLGVDTHFVGDNRLTAPIARWTGGSGFKRVNLSAGSHFVDFDFRSSESGRVSHIRHKRLIVKRLG